MSYSFEQFTEFKGKFSPIISLGKHGFGFSKGFIHKYNLENHKGVKLFFDRDKVAVGFKFVTEEEEGVIKLKARGDGMFISSRSFIGKYGLDIERCGGRYTPEEHMDEQLGKLFLVHLKNE